MGPFESNDWSKKLQIDIILIIEFFYPICSQFVISSFIGVKYLANRTRNPRPVVLVPMSTYASILIPALSGNNFDMSNYLIFEHLLLAIYMYFALFLKCIYQVYNSFHF